MIIIPAQLIDGVLSPAQPLPSGRILTACNGKEYICYMPGDELPQEQPAEDAPLVVTAITPRQARLILIKYGLLDTVNAAVESIGGAAQVEWEYATEVRRDNPLLSSVAGNLGITSEQLDALFNEASLL